VLDITAKVVFGFTLLFAREAIARYGSFLGGINTGWVHAASLSLSRCRSDWAEARALCSHELVLFTLAASALLIRHVDIGFQ
jgi:hypothetical protein